MILIILLAPIYEHLRAADSNSVDLFNRFLGPSGTYILGTDELGRDLMLRLLNGGKVSLSIGLIASIIAGSIGTVLGLTSGYFGGKIDLFFQRFMEIWSAVPTLYVLIILASVIQPNFWWLLLILLLFLHVFYFVSPK